MKVIKPSKKSKKILYWTPRILGILFIIFISIFALDVLAEDYNWWETITALAIHLIPTYILIIALLIAWKWESAGGAIYILLGLFYIWLVWNRGPWTAMLIITGISILIGILFIVSKYNK